MIIRNMRSLYLLLFILALSCRAGAVVVTVTVGDGGNYFIPVHFTINPGDTVKWVWISGHHNISGYSLPTGASSMYSNMDQTTPTYFTVPTVSGLYRYTCTHHSGMDGSFFVSGCIFPVKPVIGSSNGNAFCDGDSTQLSSVYNPAYKYEWVRNSGAIPNSDTNITVATLVGVYRLWVNHCGVDSVSDPFPVTVHPLPQPSFSHTNNDLHYTFTNTTPAPVNYSFTWSFGDGSAEQTGVDAMHSYATPGTYDVKLKAVDHSTSCSAIIIVRIRATLGVNSHAPINYTISPNPAYNAIEAVGPIGSEVWITGPQGGMRLIHHSTISGKTNIDVSSLPTGLYLLHVKSGKDYVVQKLVIAR